MSRVTSFTADIVSLAKYTSEEIVERRERRKKLTKPKKAVQRFIEEEACPAACLEQLQGWEDEPIEVVELMLRGKHVHHKLE